MSSEQTPEQQQRTLQDRYIKMCRIMRIPDSTVVSCAYPGITVADLRENLYPELSDEMRVNIALPGMPDV